MAADPLPQSASPLSSLYRSTRRRASPISSISRRNSPLSYTYERPRLDDSEDDDDAGNAPQLSALARMLLEEDGSSPRKQSSPEPERERPRWNREPSPEYRTARELVTPGPGRRAFSGASYHASGSSGSSGPGSGSAEQNKETENRYVSGATSGYGSIIRPGGPVSSTASAMRWKRAGRGLLGGGLAGAPRRGPKRDSDQQVVEESSSPEEEQPAERDPAAEQPLATVSRRSKSIEGQLQRMSVYHSSSPDNEPPSSAGEKSESPSRPDSSSMARAAALAATGAPSTIERERGNLDKENMPPPTFRRPTVGASYKRLSPLEVKPQSPLKQTQMSPERIMSPERKPALAIKSINGPLRAAPPPPKMSMLQAVTATAGAATTSSSQNARKSRATISINGRVYRRLDAIGKGGSSKVYKVMAENHKVFAMKKVSWGQHDGNAIVEGYKGEIDLLSRLTSEDRVIQLYDSEMNDEKRTLTMLMECGDTDLAKALLVRYGGEDACFDVSFARHYWKEMLECVQSVHRFNIVHSDLKPANFVVVAGRLKLIDFGIANAVQDHTVNVYRDTQVGTPNYMSPEALSCTMAAVGGGKVVKLGAPSDIWSLGCILYQMTYGRTPFAHLQSPLAKMKAIPDPEYAIEYPPTGIGGVPVPRSLINAIKSCLNRDQTRRATIADLLSDNDPFLNPDRPKEGVVEISEEMLRQLLESTAEGVIRSGKPDPGTISLWARDVFGKLKRRMEYPVR